jgi:ABC-type glycerol-3-phosphate transport system substrate-binding protein
MPSKFSTFQLAVTGAFLFLMLVGIAVFTIYGGRGGKKDIGAVVIWGTLKQDAADSILVNMAGTDPSFQSVTYVEKNPATYNADLVQAIASGRAPDLFLLSDEQVVSFGDKIQPIAYQTVSQRNFNDTFIDEGSTFLSSVGILAMPLYIDPLVMYYNRDLFASAGVAAYPKTWTQVQDMVPKMTSLDARSDVKRSAVAMGTWSNISHAKGILLTLFLQLGEGIVSRDQDGKLVVSFGGNSTNSVESPAQAALRFYTGFSNPSQSNYSWNRALPNSLDTFVSGDLGIYFGLASEYPVIARRNPNLAFSVAVVPQTAGAKARVTYGQITGLAIPRGAANTAGAVVIAQKLTDAKAAALFTQGLGLPSARRDLIADTPADTAQSVFADSALIARTWADPDPAASDAAFKSMVESVISGKAQLQDAVHAAAADLSALYDKLYAQ